MRWLLTKKRTKEASDIILNAARKNGVCLSERVMIKIRTSSEQRDAEVSFSITFAISFRSHLGQIVVRANKHFFNVRDPAGRLAFQPHVLQAFMI